MSPTPHNLHTTQAPQKKSRISRTIEKKESRTLSRFQCLGQLCGWADAIAGEGSKAGNPIAAIVGFGTELDTLGFDYYDPVHLLSAPNWKIRMYAAWCIIGSEERAIATSLDYNEVHNYWPNIDFCDSGWSDEVDHWVSKLAPYDKPFEFKVAAVAGNPPRPQLIVKP